MSNFDLTKIKDELEALEANIANSRLEREQLLDEVEDFFSKDFAAKQSQKSDSFGKVSVDHDGFKVSLTVPKSVSWDQVMLANLYDQIKAAGENPADYIDIKYSVSETKYKAWPDKIKEAFNPARSVKDGSHKIEIERV